MLCGHAGAGTEERTLRSAVGWTTKELWFVSMLSNRLSLLRTVQTRLWVTSSLLLCEHRRCSTGSKLAGTWKWPLTSRAKVKNVWHYSSTPPHTFVACARESLNYWGYISDCNVILSIHMSAENSEAFSKECKNSFLFTLDNKLKRKVSVMNMLLIYLFASMKLEKGQKKYLALVLKLCYHYNILRNRFKYTERWIK
jgi:hypothetical protein